MAIRKFLTSVADVFGYDESENLLFTAKTLLDSSIEVSLGSAPVRGGRGNQLQYVYYHTGEMKFTLTDAQWNLGFVGATIGADVKSGSGVNVYYEENRQVTVGGGNFTLTTTQTPLVFANGTTIYGWATLKDGSIVRGTFSGTTFTASAAGLTLATDDYVCVRYYRENTDGQELQINANMIPKVVKLVMEAQLNSADVSTNKIGMVQIIAPTVTLSGAFTISMKADGVANTPLTASALAYDDPTSGGTQPCSSEPYYAKLIEVIDNYNWYDSVIGLSVAGGDFGMANATSTTLQVWAIPSNGAAFKVSNSELTFAIETGTSVASVGEHTGLVTTHASTDGDSIINILITGKTAIETNVIITVA